MTKPPSAKVLPWLKENLGKNITAMLTTTDAEALQAAVHLVQLVGYQYQHPSRPVAMAMHGFQGCVTMMQTKCHLLAYHAIAMILDWPDRDKFWTACGLTTIENPGLCKYEPAARH